VALAAVVHYGLFLQLALGLEDLDTPGFLGEKRVTGHAVAQGILMAVVRKGHPSGITTFQNHTIGPARLAVGKRQD